MDRGLKRIAITLETKFEILSEIQKGLKKKDIAETFGIPPSTLSTIIKNEKEIRESYQFSYRLLDLLL
jgi:plasmid maintenance system antidote protein VapI